MIEYLSKPPQFLSIDETQIASFILPDEGNLDKKTVDSFGVEWNRFSEFTDADLKLAGDQYFDIVDSSVIGPDSTVLDIGCGTGRWSKYLSPKVRSIESIDPSAAVVAASRLTRDFPNIRVTQAGVDNIPFPDNSFDFVFSLGVMHHVPDTRQAIQKAVSKLRSGGHFLVYLYYNLDNRSSMFRLLFYPVHVLRKIISNLPSWLKVIVCDLLAVIIYLPLIALVKTVKALFPKKNWHARIPLAYYADKSFKIIRNDALDRLGTPLEKRFSRAEIHEILAEAGLKNIRFSEHAPYWHAIAQK